MQIEPQKKSMIQSRLSKRMRALDLSDFSSYCALVESNDAAEKENFISAITTNVTHFYREVHHFKQLQSVILPELADRARSGAKVRIWSAGCSTGPEPYSIAGSILKEIPNAQSLNIKVIATDLDREALAKAKAAEYPKDQCQTPGPEWEAQVFDREDRSTTRRVKPDVARLVEFQQINLNGVWPSLGTFDVIFCRNVAIYFDREVQNRLWKRFI
ncbi:MAG: CheR family methyltransferase, partial [Pseudomonadota bacterium]